MVRCCRGCRIGSGGGVRRAAAAASRQATEGRGNREEPTYNKQRFTSCRSSSGCGEDAGPGVRRGYYYSSAVAPSRGLRSLREQHRQDKLAALRSTTVVVKRVACGLKTQDFAAGTRTSRRATGRGKMLALRKNKNGGGAVRGKGVPALLGEGTDCERLGAIS
ncbi:hypothetical protein P154DRAFT_212028 [Amniculicola lignicola CBS 123094]|uniref:Uncharacterized protein n=1 Tax=Amniculicola lignicola CBS 123094 TaxID=1392246 RepID=A0A6A5WER6_9PLEO|nr:hypothetical protein P154DRAFT_212028 [Amniculicola lignicola CBS 123094]